MKTALSYLKKIPTIICVGSTDRNKTGELRKLSLMRYEKNKWRVTYLLDDIGDRNEWTDDGFFFDKVPIVNGDSLLDCLIRLDWIFFKKKFKIKKPKSNLKQ